MKLLYLTTLVLLVCSSPATTQDDDSHAWQLQKDEEGIRVLTRDVEGSKFKAVRAVMETDFRLSSVVALIRDSEACPRWADLCKQSKLLKTISETELLVYNLNDIPWPVKDRDAVTRVIWEQDPDTNAVTMTATAIDSELVPASNKAVRLKDAVTRWILTPRSNGQLEVASEGHIDPAGPTPAWLTNLLLLDSPFKTLQNLRKQLETDRYANTSFEFIHEP